MSDLEKAARELLDAMEDEARELDRKRARLLNELIPERYPAKRQPVANVRDDESWNAAKRMAVSLGYDPDEYDIDFPVLRPSE